MGFPYEVLSIGVETSGDSECLLLFDFHSFVCVSDCKSQERVPAECTRQLLWRDVEIESRTGLEAEFLAILHESGVACGNQRPDGLYAFGSAVAP